MKSHPLFEKKRIFAPGPTPVPQEVLAELAKSPLHHRTKEFSDLLARVKEGLQFLFQTTQPAYLFAATGTGAMEASIVNLFSAGDEVIVINGGKFGQRWGKIAERFELKVHNLEVEWGKAVDPNAVEALLKQNPNTKGVLFQGSETSTGVMHPVEKLAATIKKNSDALIIVDAITTLGVTDLPMDDWGLDAVVGGSQKALMLPPGLAFLALSKRANEQRKNVKTKRFYFDLDSEEKAASSGQTAWTPAVSLICGLEPILQSFRNSGLKEVFTFHHRLAEATRVGVKAMGLNLLAPDAPSPAVTAIQVPSGIEGKLIVSHLRDRYGITIAGGQDHLKGKIFRIGHLGFYDELDMLTVLSAVEMTLKKLGVQIKLGAGVGAASQYLIESEKNG